jgi:hypothetical protein
LITQRIGRLSIQNWSPAVELQPLKPTFAVQELAEVGLEITDIYQIK